MARNWIESAVGAGVLAVAIWFLIFSYQSVSNSGGPGSYRLSAEFDGIDGVHSGADVRISGITIGSVSALTLTTEPYRANVELDIQQDIEIPIDSSIAVKRESLLGGRYLAISPGADPELLGDGEEFEFTQSALVLEDLIGKLLFSNDAEN